jgi:hypothetical protein
MYNPAVQPSDRLPELPPPAAGIANPSDALTEPVRCGLCGTPIGTLAELELVAATAVHSMCLRYLIMAGEQMQGGFPPSQVV